MQSWSASASTTLIGSMPHKDPEKVIGLILKEMPEIPVWPQLPASRQAEQMMFQYLEGLPGIKVEDDRLFMQTDSSEFEQELYGFYEEYLQVDMGEKNIADSRFKMGPETGGTFFQFLDAAGRISSPLRAVKGQIVGPFTLLAGLKDQRERALLYDERMQDAVAKHLAMKAKWQIDHLKSLGCPVIVFLDEPALAGFGSSAFISISAELIGQMLKEVIDAVHQAGAMAGIHICANTDWLLAFDSDVDIINFDAYNYFDKFALYGKAFSRFIEEGRTVAWGMVPTSDAAAIERETAQGLADRWFEHIQELSSSEEIPIEKILSQSLFTPSCGCGSLPEPSAERVVLLTRELGRIMQSACKR